jgi:uncharacterized membrane protein (DUF4010 family)
VHGTANNTHFGKTAMGLLFREFSTPGGVRSHCGPPPIPVYAAHLADGLALTSFSLASKLGAGPSPASSPKRVPTRMPTYPQAAWNGLIVLLMGLLIGLERQHSTKSDEPLFAGVRTFPLIALLGFFAGFLCKAGYTWVLPASLLGVSAIVVAAYLVSAQSPHKGATTEFVAILTFLLGATAALGYLILAATFAVLITLLLSIKAPLHALVEKISEDEIYAVVKFCIVSVIILPLLPNRGFGPFGVMNPWLVWWMVVLISALSMVGYLLIRLLGAQQGIVLTGFLGGIASSTAATYELSEQSRKSEVPLARYFTLGILIACTIMFARVLVVTFIISHQLAGSLFWPTAIPLLAGALGGLILWWTKKGTAGTTLKGSNPMALGNAIKFGALFAAVLILSRAAYQYFGTRGLYVAGSLAGTTDVDSFTISASRMFAQGVIPAGTANVSILLACSVNTLVKGGIAIFVGGAGLRRLILPVMGALFGASLLACLMAAQV